MQGSYLKYAPLKQKQASTVVAPKHYHFLKLKSRASQLISCRLTLAFETRPLKDNLTSQRITISQNREVEQASSLVAPVPMEKKFHTPIKEIFNTPIKLHQYHSKP